MRPWCRLAALLVAATLLLGAEPRERRRRGGGISALGQVVEAFDEAATGAAKIWQVLFTSDGAADEGVEGVTEDTRERLKSLSAKLAKLVAIQRGEVFLKIEDYIESPSEESWRSVESALQDVLVQINGLLESIADEQSDFVLERTYLDLFVVLRSRAGVARRLIDLPPPETPEEMHLLRQIQARYIELVGNLERAIAELNRYLAATEPGGDSG